MRRYSRRHRARPGRPGSATIAASRTDSILADTNAKIAALVAGYRVAYITVAFLLGLAALLILAFLRCRHLAAQEASTPGISSP